MNNGTQRKKEETFISKTTEKLLFRTPTKEDGADVWKLIKKTGNLDLNSAYCYLMLCEFFADTCVVAERNKQIVGFISSFIQPNANDTLFVWQVAVDPSQQGNGLGKALLRELLKQSSGKGIQYVEATISPSNLPSTSLFKGLARDLSTKYESSECFSPNLFPEPGHEAEITYRIGPFSKENLKNGKVVEVWRP